MTVFCAGDHATVLYPSFACALDLSDGTALFFFTMIGSTVPQSLMLLSSFVNVTVAASVGTGLSLPGFLAPFSYTYRICLSTSMKDLSSNVTFTLPVNSPAAALVLAGSVASVIVALSSRPCSSVAFAACFAVSLSTALPAQLSVSPTKAAVAFGAKPPAFVILSALVSFFVALALNVLH